MAQYGNLLTLSNEEREELTRWAQSRTLPAGDVFRARLILALADRLSYREIEKKLHTNTPTIARWRKRFEQHRVEGLNPQHKGCRPRVVTPAIQARIVRRTQQAPPDGSTHWSCRKLAQALGVGKSTVQRVWTQAQLMPHRLDRYIASNDPEFESKAAEIIGPYLIRLSMPLCSAPHQTASSAMLGFKRLETAAITISGIELVERIRKQQFKIGNLPVRPVSVPDPWAAVLAA